MKGSSISDYETPDDIWELVDPWIHAWIDEADVVIGLKPKPNAKEAADRFCYWFNGLIECNVEDIFRQRGYHKGEDACFMERGELVDHIRQIYIEDDSFEEKIKEKWYKKPYKYKGIDESKAGDWSGVEVHMARARKQVFFEMKEDDNTIPTGGPIKENYKYYMKRYAMESASIADSDTSINAMNFVKVWVNWQRNEVGNGTPCVVRLDDSEGTGYGKVPDLSTVVEWARELWKNDSMFQEHLKLKWGRDAQEVEDYVENSDRNTTIEHKSSNNRNKNKLTGWESDEVDEENIKDEDETEEDGEGGDKFFKEESEEDEEDSLDPLVFEDSIVHNDDCVEVMKRYALNGETFIDAIITDPPYGMGYDSRGDEHDTIAGDATVDEAMELIDAVMQEANKCLRKGAPVIMFCGDSNLAETVTYFKENYEFLQVIPWDKEVIGTSGINGNLPRWRPEHEFAVYGTHGKADFTNPNRHDGSVLHFQKLAGVNMDHPTQKPTELLQYIIRSVTEKDQVVFDPFVGSGTTAVASKSEGRKYLACELDEKHYDTTVERLKFNSLAEFA